VRVNVNERDEITASVAAHAELGSRYDSAVAEGLVERIGDEIDRRIDARLGGQPRPAQPPPGENRPVSAGQAPVYQGPTYQTPAAPPPVPATAPPPAAPRRASGLSGMVLGLGSMGLGVGATAVVVGHHVESVAALLMVLLIWTAIAVINIAHSRRLM
jgi:hypothetical protein